MHTCFEGLSINGLRDRELPVVEVLETTRKGSYFFTKNPSRTENASAPNSHSRG